MNSKDSKRIEGELKEIRMHMRAIHDDVLILKTQRDTATKFFYIIAGLVSFITALATGYFWR